MPIPNQNPMQFFPMFQLLRTPKPKRPWRPNCAGSVRRSLVADWQCLSGCTTSGKRGTTWTLRLSCKSATSIRTPCHESITKVWDQTNTRIKIIMCCWWCQHPLQDKFIRTVEKTYTETDTNKHKITGGFYTAEAMKTKLKWNQKLESFKKEFVFTAGVLVLDITNISLVQINTWLIHSGRRSKEQSSYAGRTNQVNSRGRVC